MVSMADWQRPTAEKSPPLAAESAWAKPTPTACSGTPRGRLHDNSWTTPSTAQSSSQSQSSSSNSWTRPAPATPSAEVAEVKAKGGRQTTLGLEIRSAEVAEVKPKGGRQTTLGLEILTFAQRQSGRGNESAYARNGRSRSRIRRVVQGNQKSCSPACRQRCWERVRPAELQAICDMYWSLKAEDQSYLAGLPVCPTSELRGGFCSNGDRARGFCINCDRERSNTGRHTS